MLEEAVAEVAVRPAVHQAAGAAVRDVRPGPRGGAHARALSRRPSGRSRRVFLRGAVDLHRSRRRRGRRTPAPKIASARTSTPTPTASARARRRRSSSSGWITWSGRSESEETAEIAENAEKSRSLRSLRAPRFFPIVISGCRRCRRATRGFLPRAGFFAAGFLGRGLLRRRDQRGTRRRAGARLPRLGAAEQLRGRVDQDRRRLDVVRFAVGAARPNRSARRAAFRSAGSRTLRRRAAAGSAG